MKARLTGTPARLLAALVRAARDVMAFLRMPRMHEVPRRHVRGPEIRQARVVDDDVAGVRVAAPPGEALPDRVDDEEIEPERRVLPDEPVGERPVAFAMHERAIAQAMGKQ